MGLWIVKLILVAAAAYLLGCANGAILVSKYILHDDIRQHGSGNAGLTNFFRVFGGKSTILVILSDMLKIVVAMLIGMLVLGNLGDYAIPSFGKLWAAMFCMIGHDFPAMFGFKGGKGVLSGGAMTLMFDWRVALLCWGFFLLAVVLTRYISLGSIAAGLSFIISSCIFYPYPVDMIIIVICGGLLLWGHRGNIVRLLHGNERKFSFHKKGDHQS
jgi:glycerol-3-phosphate acyltransferase PlsY